MLGWCESREPGSTSCGVASRCSFAGMSTAIPERKERKALSRSVRGKKKVNFSFSSVPLSLLCFCPVSLLRWDLCLGQGPKKRKITSIIHVHKAIFPFHSLFWVSLFRVP